MLIEVNISLHFILHGFKINIVLKVKKLFEPDNTKHWYFKTHKFNMSNVIGTKDWESQNKLIWRVLCWYSQIVAIAVIGCEK